MSQLYALEVFAGSARLTAEIRLLGLQDSLGIDHRLQSRLPAPVLSLDLSESSAREIVMSILDSPNLIYIHLAPPCGTASRARDIQRCANDPPPARSDKHPDGLPDLHKTHPALHARVLSANALYEYSGFLFAEAFRRGIFASLENPARSHVKVAQGQLHQHAKAVGAS